MVDITEISAIVAAAGVLIGVVFAVFQLRDLVRTRQSDVLMRMHLAFSSKEYCDAALKMGNTDYKDYDDFVKKYGHPFAEGPVQSEWLMMCMFFEGIGILTKRKLVNRELVFELFGVYLFWEKVKPMVDGLRKKMNNPHTYEWFEYLYNEEKKYYQKLASKTA
jgi:hypothetical protein